MSSNKPIEERVATLESQQKDMGRRMGVIENDNKSLTRLTTLLEKQMETSEEKDKEHQRQISKQNDVLTDISKSLTSIDNSQKALNEDFTGVKERVGKLEENGTVNINKLIKRTIFIAIPSLIITGILIAIGWK